jgi:hypothetical protein
MFLDKQNRLFCYLVWHDEYVSMSELAQPYMTFYPTLWLADENLSHRLFPKNRSRGNLCGVPRKQQFGRVRR